MPVVVGILLALSVASQSGLVRAEAPFYPITAHVVRERDGVPMASTIVSVRDIDTNTPYDFTTDANGEVVMNFPVGSNLQVFPSMGIVNYHPWNPMVRATPTVATVSNLSAPVNVEFEIKPGVLVTVSAPNSGPSFEGVEVFAGYPIFQVVATFPRYGYQVWFYPDDYDSGFGSVMALSGYVALRDGNPFTVIVPQALGDYIQYDCTNVYIDGNGPVYPMMQHIEPVTDSAAEYTPTLQKLPDQAACSSPRMIRS
ncbi:MAG: hypothetical protein IH621_18505 [Krumholzibacteria bacterium]|nr:hypothetical protein [Candidatus Krumholzibacteria bacterium]